MNDVLTLKTYLSQKNIQGLALDIDETLAWTNGYWIGQMQRLFGNPENVDVQTIIEKYRYTQHVPYWQSREVLRWIEEQRDSNDVQECLPPIEGAFEAVQKIHQLIPIVLYATARSEQVKYGTQVWLKKHRFPPAALLSRPLHLAHTAGNRWKAGALSILFPQIVGIVDDNPEILRYLPSDYKGVIFLYNHSDCPKTSLQVIPCKTWQIVLEQISIYVGLAS